MARAFHLRVAEAVRPDFAARRAFYAGPLGAAQLEALGASSRLVLESARFAAVLTFFERAVPDEPVVPAEVRAAMAAFGEFRPRFDLRGKIVGAIRVDRARPGQEALLGIGRRDPPPPVPGQSTVFLARLRADDGTEGLVHVATASPRDTWPGAEFLERLIVAHVDRGDAMP